MLYSKYFQRGSPAVSPLALSHCHCHCHVGAEPTCTQRQRDQRQRIQYFLGLKKKKQQLLLMLPPINHTQNISTSRHIHGMNAGAGIIDGHFFLFFLFFFGSNGS
jgi:hypothetical protein